VRKKSVSVSAGLKRFWKQMSDVCKTSNGNRLKKGKNGGYRKMETALQKKT